MLEGEPLERYSFTPAWAPASLGTSLPGRGRKRVSKVLAHLLDEFHLPIQEVALQEVTEVVVVVGSALAEPKACRFKRA